MPRLTDKGFVYTPSFATDIGERFKRMKREQERRHKLDTKSKQAKALLDVAAASPSVVPIARRKP